MRTLVWLVLTPVLVAACGGGGGGGEAAVTLADINADGSIVVLCVGDSITRGSGDGVDPNRAPPLPAGYPRRLQDIIGVPVVNSGVGGERTQDGARRIRREIEASRADFVIILFGTNNVTAQDAGRAPGDLQAMINTTRELGSTPILATLTPTCCNRSRITPESGVLGLNTNIRDVALANQIELIDFHEAFAPGGTFDATSGLIHNPDGLHPTPAGYDLMGVTAAAVFGF